MAFCAHHRIIPLLLRNALGYGHWASDSNISRTSDETSSMIRADKPLSQSMTSASAAIASGILDSISAGILLYRYAFHSIRHRTAE